MQHTVSDIMLAAEANVDCMDVYCFHSSPKIKYLHICFEEGCNMQDVDG